MRRSTLQTPPRQMSSDLRKLSPRGMARTAYPTKNSMSLCMNLNMNPNVNNTTRNLLHMDECTDPDCLDLEQLRDLQKSLDHFTDYDHYEKCCDGRHGADGVCTNAHDKCCDEPDHCLTDDFFDDCDECQDEHNDCYEEVDVCPEDDCEQCEDECEELGHVRIACPEDHPTTRDNCVANCDTCMNDPSLPLLGPTNEFDLHGLTSIVQEITPCTMDCSPSLHAPMPPPLLQDHSFDIDMDHWQTFVQGHHCAPDPCLINHVPRYPPPQHVDPSFGFTFGCDPTIASNQYPWQKQQSYCSVPVAAPDIQSHFNPPAPVPIAILPAPAPPPLLPTTPSMTTPSSSPLSTQPQEPVPDRVCQWLMPCGSICGSTFHRTEDLKKHVKNSHQTKGTLTCRWSSCTSHFASEAALTGHISKKHLLSLHDENEESSRPWKCTFPDCAKSFMYKQVRDEHVASHNGGNRMHCPVCHQWLNAEGSNFRRHMASHGDKSEYLRCKFEGAGCRKRFPRLDNLRRHEACCKVGKRVKGVHHHHHRVHVPSQL